MTDLSDPTVAVPAVEPTTSRPRPRPRREAGDGGLARRPRAAPKRASTAELADFNAWLASLELGVVPTIHINGAASPACVVTVDFGTPRKVVRLNPDQSTELVLRMRNVTRTVMNRPDCKVGVMNDHGNGMWWTTVTA